ncbi:ferritin-like domain-containing protein [Pelagibius sp.]|uniref:ferritin-like domain-containing protein n=1 Tax=Pelagibius sp. TaxID=1931238 RepID=UPI003B501FCB
MTTPRAAQLESLLDKGQAAVARPLGDLWKEIAARERAEDDRLAQVLAGQFLAGEEITARVCESLAPHVPHGLARDCLALQAAEERRHAELYRRYLDTSRNAGRSDEDAPALLAPAGDAIMAWRGPPEAVLLAVQVIIEGEALAFQETARRFTGCTRFAALSHTIARDEARHVAFGRTYLPSALHHLTPRERSEIYVWLRRLWFGCMEHLPRVSPLPWFGGPLARHWARRRWSHWEAQLAVFGIGPSATSTVPTLSDPLP